MPPLSTHDSATSNTQAASATGSQASSTVRGRLRTMAHKTPTDSASTAPAIQWYSGSVRVPAITGGSQAAPEVDNSTSSAATSTISKAPKRMKCGGNGPAWVLRV